VRTKNELSRYALSFSALLLLLPVVYPAQQGDRSPLSTPAMQAGPAIELEPPPGPQPPCGNEGIPAYPGVDQPATVKSWSKSDLGRDWKPPACTGWTEAGFTTLVTISARFLIPRNPRACFAISAQFLNSRGCAIGRLLTSSGEH
jgi:hypothetical protein